MYSAVFDKTADKFLRKLPKDFRKRIYDKVEEAQTNPFHFFERLSGRPEFKLRVGDYRVLADIDEAKQLIAVTYICHRRNVYEKN